MYVRLHVCKYSTERIARIMPATTYPEGALKKVQAIELQLLEEFDRICRKNSLTYFIDGGSTLGAVRHGGFIPWDDDIDVGMPSYDYERFLAIAPHELCQGISLHTHENTPGYSLFFAKLYKDGTRFVDENAAASGCPQGIFLDIFPFYALDADPQKGSKSRKKALMYQRIAFVKRNAHPHFPVTMSHRKLIGAACTVAHYTIARLWSIEQLYALYKKAYETDNPGTLWVNANSGDAVPRKQEWLFPTKEIPFESLMVMAPNDCDAFLRAEYGEYMKLPPEDKRRTHMPLVLDFGDGTNVME